jgi:hypothetical protein
MRNYQAANELQRVAPLSAFNVAGYVRRDKVNQHSTIYEFPDGSRMQILHTRQIGNAWHPAWRGTASDIHLGPVKGLAIQAGARGK